MHARGYVLSLAIATLFSVLSSCTKDSDVPYELNEPEWFPVMSIPADNQLTAARVKLGRKLFYDPLLSLDSSVSCGTCHLSEKAFTDGLPKSIGVDGAIGMRNAPTLTNIGYSPLLFHDGGVETLELQSQSPIFAENEMRFSIAGFLERIADDQHYHRLFQEAYGRLPDAFGISRAIASFERTLVSGNSRYDQFEHLGDHQALSDSEKRGKNLFFSAETKCSECHVPPLFTDYQFENIGLYPVYADSGRARITHLAEDRGKFKVPTLRNIAQTAPYMHDGSLETLGDVVDHFDVGGVGHVNQSDAVHPLSLSQNEKEDLIAFLHALTDESFLNDPVLVE